MQIDAARGFRLSPQQEALWLCAHGQATFRAVCAIVVRGPLHKDALRQSALAVVARHEILRTTFHRRAGISLPFQVVGDGAAVGLAEVDLRGNRERLDAVIEDEGRRPVDLEQGPLCHLTLVALGEDENAVIVSLPALAADTLSLGNLVQEIRHFYAKAEGGTQAAIVDEPLQYADYAEFQRERLASSATVTKSLGSKRDGDLGKVAALPFARSVDPGAAFDPAFVPLHLDVAAITRLGRSGLLAAWETLLARCSGEPSVVVQVAFDGREDEEVTGAIGLFARAVPVHGTVDATLSFDELAARAKTASVFASGLRDESGGDTTGRTAAAFEYVERAVPGEGSAVTFSVIRQYSHAAPFGVKLACAVGQGEASAELHFDQSVYARDDIERAAASLEVLIESAAAGGISQVGALAIVSAAEKERILEGFNRTTAALSGACIHELFEAQAARTPDRPALAFGDVTLTYAELNARANRLAVHLRRHGVVADAPVALAMERSAEMIIGLLGILKAGGGYVPLLPGAPKARLAHQLAEIGAKALVTQQKLLSLLPDFAGKIVCLDRDAGLLSEGSDANPARVNTAADLAYVIYTSGSTGAPKGVAVTHANVVNYTLFMCEKLRLADAAAGLHFATVSTIAADLGNTCIFPSLASGGCLHVIAEDVAMDGDRFAAHAKQHPIDVLKITPSHLAALLASRDAAAILPRRALITGGEASSWALVSRVRALSKVAWINHYGPTETTIGSLTFDLDESFRAHAATVPIGRPIANTRGYVLDSARGLLPVGAPGELYLGGRGVARGYLKQPEQTAARFVVDPFVAGSASRMYRTGDRVRWLAGGDIEFLGRVDDQVKIRGYRVEPEEACAALKKHPSVRQAVVTAREDQPGELRLVAYVVATTRAAPKADELKSFLALALPDYMIPSAFVALDELPLTPNGKVDRAALPAPEQVADGQGAFVAARTPTEERLAAIWVELLGAPRVGAHDNFFDLGGHSLLATQIIARTRSTFAVQISLRTLFENPTVEGLAAAVDAAPKENADEDLARMMSELEGLSDEEVALLLAAEQG